MRFLERAAPPVGSEVAAPPRQIVLTFTEGVEPLFSTIELRDAGRIGGADRQAAVGAGQQPAACRRSAGVGSGDYTVIWHATSVDTHKTEGSYRFTVSAMSAWRTPDASIRVSGCLRGRRIVAAAGASHVSARGCMSLHLRRCSALCCSRQRTPARPYGADARLAAAPRIGSALAGLIAGIAWLMVEAAAIAGADSVAMTLHAVPTVALQTQFGHWLLLRLRAADRRVAAAASRGDRDPDRIGGRGACRAAAARPCRARWAAVPARN